MPALPPARTVTTQRVVVISGGNLDPELFLRILAG